MPFVRRLDDELKMTSYLIFCERTLALKNITLEDVTGNISEGHCLKCLYLDPIYIGFKNISLLDFCLSY